MPTESILKTCPFCGREAVETFNSEFGYQVYCGNTECFMNELVMRGNDTPEKALRKWNKRIKGTEVSLGMDRKALQEKEQLPAKIGQEMYFILYDEVDKGNINGWVVSHPHKVLDVSARGFFTGDEENFPYNADFTEWEQLGKDVFTSEKEAWEEARKRGLEK